MSTATTDPKSHSDVPARCPACGQRLTELVRGRCPLCDYAVVDEPVTTADHTPYAESEHYGRKAWLGMCGWVWGAGSQRLAHLGLMQSSPASRRFRRANLLLMAATVAVCCLSLSGWHAVEVVPDATDNEPQTPAGRGWYQVASLASSTAVRNTEAGRIVAWWWNPPQALAAAALGLTTTLAMSAVLMAILRRGVERSLRRPYRGQQRLAAALGYATTWGLPLIPAGLILALLPLCRVAALADWPIKPPAAVVYVSAAVIAAAGIASWLFGLVRLATTVPVRSRRAVAMFCGLWMPLIAAALIVGSMWGLLAAWGILVPALDLGW